MLCVLISWLCFGTWAWRADLALSLPVTPPNMESHFLRACQESGREDLTPRLGVKSACLPTSCRMVALFMSQPCYFLPSSAGTWLRDDSNWCGSRPVPCGWPSMWWGGFTMALLCHCPFGPLGSLSPDEDPILACFPLCFKAFLFHIKIDLWGNLCDVDIGFLCLYNVFGWTYVLKVW